MGTIAGAKILQERFSRSASLQPGDRRAAVRLGGAAVRAAARARRTRELVLGDDLADPLAETLWKACELVTVAHGTKAIHDVVATTIETAPIQQPDERLDCFSRDGRAVRLSPSFTVTHDRPIYDAARLSATASPLGCRSLTRRAVGRGVE